jgi:hypothetical protein
MSRTCGRVDAARRVGLGGSCRLTRRLVCVTIISFLTQTCERMVLKKRSRTGTGDHNCKKLPLEFCWAVGFYGPLGLQIAA